ncbi:MAG: LON peptidase substrate-binding domain-containing protein [Acidobacteria bacterium]|nr:LON peptidase substrate-binding domain-containing protein [Acidobacteriota bacterium]
MQADLLPLFPLDLVLLPHNRLPLRIFEPRYQEMIGEAIRNDSEFGVVLATENGVSHLGCSARVVEVTQRHPDGRFDILAIGVRRFEIVLLNQEKDYLRASVQFFDDDDPAPAPILAREQALTAFQVLAATEGLDVETPHPDAPQLSFLLARAVPEIRFRQLLLSLRSEAARVRHLAEFLPFYAARQQRIAHVKQVAPRNGSGQSKPEL